MQICLDVQAAIAQRAGVGRYTQRLVEHLDALDHPHDLRLFFFDFKRNGWPFPLRRASVRPVRWCPGRLAQKSWQTLGAPAFDRFSGPADLFHFPNFILPPLRRGRAVVTVHDLSFLRHPEFAEARNEAFLRHRIRDTAARADCILTDSQFSADEIRELLAVPADRVAAVHLGVSPDFQRPPPADVARHTRAFGLERPYLLTVGTIEPRKNLIHLVDTFERLNHYDGDLVLAGRLGWKYESILERIRRSPRANRIRLLHEVDDAALPALYAGADAFLIASHYEGFGFPPLEAMACGTPVISSTGGSLAEVLGDGAILLDSFDFDRWTHAIQHLLASSDDRRALVARGHARVARYTWPETARRTLAVYEAVAGRS
jgi:glycosyltransferase involved in cell wall biosynthesis